MAQAVIEVIVPGTMIKTSGWRTSEIGYIISMVLTFPYEVPLFPGAYVKIGANLGGRGDEFTTAIFFEGPVGWDRFAYWHGRYLLEPSEELFLEAYSYLPATFRAVFKLEK